MSGQSVLEQFAQTSGISQVNSGERYPAHHAAGDAGLPMLVIDNALGHAVIALQGAQLMAFRPAGQREMLWVSPKCVLEAGRPMRGGIPLCLPWFGPGPDGKSMHGFARTSPWSLVAVERQQNGATRLVLALDGDASVSALWPHAFAFRLEVTVGRELKLALSIINRSDEAAPLAFAFHSYFAVPDVAQVSVSGLDATNFIDKMDNGARKPQQGDVTISAETDRIYLDVPARQTLNSAERRVDIESDASCAVLWNAWSNDRNIADLGAGNHLGYLCVERGALADRAVTLPPGGEYRTAMTLSCRA